MKTYYLRCIESDKPLLFNLAQKLGLLVDVDGVLTPQGCTWVEIGYIPLPTGKIIVNEDGTETPETAPSADKNGNKYWHINLRVEPPLDQIASEIYAKTKDKTIGAAMADMARFFVADADGQPIAPKAPFGVFL